MQHQQAKINNERKTQLIRNHNKHQEDGLNSVKYKRMKLRNERLYTNISVEL